MHEAKQVGLYGLMVAAIIFFVTCSQTPFLANIEQKVEQAKTNNSLTVANPVFSPGSGQYPDNQLITITDSTAGAKIYYTTAADGAMPPDPTTSSTVYSGSPISLVGTNGTTTTYKATAMAPGMNNSEIVTSIYTGDF